MNRVLISIEGRFFDEEQAGDTVQELVLERTTAYLSDFDVLEVAVLAIRRLPD